MRAILVVFDTLNRRFLQPYAQRATITPNFSRLAQRSATFLNAYAGSLPCMPARRDLLTGRLNFLHAAWGPFEPFEQAFTQVLAQNGVYSRLVTDHYHYLEEGGSGYHTKFSTWECIRGQEGDPWKGRVQMPDVSHLKGRRDIHRAQDIVNRGENLAKEAYPIHQVFEKSIQFMEENQFSDQWLLQIESFDPHEPFCFAPEFAPLCDDGNAREEGMEWPSYEKCTETAEEVGHTVKRYRGAVSSCDYYLAKVLDAMDRLQMWQDTVLLVTTDHGFLLGEHGWWGKSVQPCYNEIANIPFFLWHPWCPELASTQRKELVQWIDIAPTLLEAFGLPPMPQGRGQSLLGMLTGRLPPRESAIFGYFGGHVNVTDGRYVYMRAADESRPIFEYTLAPYSMKTALPVEVLQRAELAQGTAWSRGCPVLKIPGGNWGRVDMKEYPTMLFDLAQDPGELHQIKDERIEREMEACLQRELLYHQAPPELWPRLGFRL